MSTTPTSAGVRAGSSKYQVVRRIGLNGSSELFLGRGAGGSGDQVVIKRLTPAAAQREEEVARFTNEARVAMALRHPNIIPAVDFGKDEIGWFLVLSAVQGQALRRVIDAHGGPFPLQQAFVVILEVSRALIHAHQVPDPRGMPGILHRGISPVSILMGVDGVTRLLDFGLERPAPRADDDPRRVRYLSPEQACGAPLDPRSDVYSLGAVLFELTTGRPLFGSSSTPELLRSIVDGEIIAPSSVIADYPLDLEELVIRALARDPSARFDHAGDLAASLEVFLVRNELMASTEQMAAWLKPLLGAPKAPEAAKQAPVSGGVATVRAEASAALKLAQEKQASTRREIDARRAQKAAAEVSARAGEVAGDTVASFQAPSEMDPPLDLADTQINGDVPLVLGESPSAAEELDLGNPVSRGSGFAPPPLSPETSRDTEPEDIALPPSDTEPGLVPAHADLQQRLQTAVEREAEAAQRAQEATERNLALEQERAGLEARLAELERKLAEVPPPVEPDTRALDEAMAREEEARAREAEVRAELEGAKKALETVRKQAEGARQEALTQRQRADAADSLMEAARRELVDKDEAQGKEFSNRLKAEVAQVEASALRMVDAAKRETEALRKELEEQRAETESLRAELERVTAEGAEVRRQADEATAAAEAATRDAQEARAAAEAATADAAARSESESAASARAQNAISDAERARAEAKTARKEADAAKRGVQKLQQQAKESEAARAAAEAAVKTAEERRAQLELTEQEDAAKRKAEVAAAMQVVRTAMEQANEAQQDAEAARAEAEQARVNSAAAKAEADEALNAATAARTEADRVLAEAAEIRARADAVARAAAATRREANASKAEAERVVREAEEKKETALALAEQIRESSEAREASAKRAEQASFEMVQAAAHSMEAAKQEAALARTEVANAKTEAKAARAEFERLTREARAAQALANAAILEAESTLERIEAVRRDVLLDTEIATLQGEEARWAAHAERMKALLRDAPVGEELDAAFDGLLLDAPPPDESYEPSDTGTSAVSEPTVDDTATGASADEGATVDEGAPIEEGAAIEEGAPIESPPMDTVPEAHVPAGEDLDSVVDEPAEGSVDDGAPGSAARVENAPDWTEAAPLDAPVSSPEGATPVALAGRTNLAADDSPFVGREALLASLEERFAAGERLIVLHGAPGTGRTRLARQLASRYLLELSKLGGVWYVSLLHARSSSDICRGIGRALSLRLSDQAAAADAQIAASLAARRKLLVVLDDVDGVAASLPALVGGWIAAAEEATFVVVGESADVMPEAAVVPVTAMDDEDGARHVQAIHARVHPGQTLDGGGASAVAALLGGGPLASELTVGTGLAPKDLGKELSGKLAKATDAEVLQRVLEWRWSRLNGWEKLCFAHASVFEGSFATDAAAAVIDLTAHAKAPPMGEIMESLRATGLLEVAGAGRWEFHPSVGSFASTKLPASPRAKVSARRDAFVNALATELAPFAEARSGDALGRLSDERVQLTACVRRALQDGKGVKDALVLLRALGPLFEREGLADEIIAWADAALDAAEKANIKDAAVASLLRLRALFRKNRGDGKEALAELEQAEEIAASANDAILLAQLRIDTSRLLASDPAKRKLARTKLDKALAAAERTDDLRLQACVLAEIGELGRFAGLDQVAKDAYERALGCAEKTDRALECELRARFGQLLAESGARAPARAHLGTAVAFATELGNRATAARAAHVLGLLALEEGFAEPAEERFRFAIETWAEIGERHDEAIAWGDLAIALELQGRGEDARRSRAWAMSVLGELEDKMNESVQRAYVATADAIDGDAKASREAFAIAKRGTGKGPEGDLVELLHVCAEVALAKAEGNAGAMRQKKAAAALKIAARGANDPLAMRIARRIASRALEGDA